MQWDYESMLFVRVTNEVLKWVTWIRDRASNR